MENNTEKLVNLIEDTKSIAEGASNNANELANELKSAKETIEAQAKELEETKSAFSTKLDEAVNEFKSIAINTKSKPKGPWAEAIEQVMEAKSALMQGGKFNMEVKDVTYGAGDGANVPMEERIADIKVDPHFQTSIRNHIPMKPTSADSVRYNRRALIESSNSPVAGLALNQDASARSNFSDYSPQLSNERANVITFGAISTINEEQLDDVLGLQSFLQNDLMGFAMDRENLELLQGTDSTTSLQSFNSEGTAWVDQRPAGEGAVLRANYFDVLINGISQLAQSNYMATKIFLSPAAFWSTNFALAKSTQGEYVYKQMTQTGKAYLGGAELVITPAVTGDNFYIISDNSCAYHLREGIGVEFYRQNDDFAKNNISVRVKLRGAHTVYLPGGIVRGDFSDAQAELLAAQA